MEEDRDGWMDGTRIRGKGTPAWRLLTGIICYTLHGHSNAIVRVFVMEAWLSAQSKSKCKRRMAVGWDGWGWGV